MEERKYFVKRDWIFNLESMHDKLFALLIRDRDGEKIFPMTICGKTIRTEADVYEFNSECEELKYKAECGKVTGKEYGRIKDIVTWRVNARYGACINAGMDERKASICFSEV